jgi:hypothetical protein
MTIKHDNDTGLWHVACEDTNIGNTTTREKARRLNRLHKAFSHGDKKFEGLELDQTTYVRMKEILTSREVA